MCDDCAIPTHPGRHDWLFETVENEYPEKTERSGKWCFYIPAQQIDTLWSIVRVALAMGKLGKKAKTKKRWYAGKQSSDYVVVVYTYDATDHTDVFRVAQELINMGIMDAFYKTDEQTHQALYNGPMKHKQGGYRPMYRIDQGMILSREKIT